MSFPPRPNAIITLFGEEDIKNSQCLLFALKSYTDKHKKGKEHYYAPEIVLLCRNSATKESLRKSSTSPSLTLLCDRVLFLSEDQSRLPKICLFSKVEYENILFIDCSCLVMKDVAHLFETERETLHAVPRNDTTGPFFTLVLLFQPSTRTFEALLQSTASSSDEDQIICSLFSSTFEKLPSKYLSPTKHSDTIILSHTFSQTLFEKSCKNLQILQEQTTTYMKKLDEKKKKSLDALEQKKFSLKQQKQTELNDKSVEQITQKREQEKRKHASIASSFKELRKKGLSVKEAMIQARQNANDYEGKEPSIGEQVANMLGVR